MIFLLLSVCCTLTLANIFKHAERRNYDRFGLITANYVVGIGMVILVLAVQGGLGETLTLQVEPGFIALGVLEGCLFVAGLFMLTLATRYAGLSLSVGIQRTSVVIPFAASWLLFGEMPTPFQFAGLAVGAVAFFLIARRPQWPAATVLDDPGLVPPGSYSSIKMAVVLTLLFLVGGSVDFVFKVFDVRFAEIHGRTSFLLVVFSTALVLCAILLIWRGLRTGRWPSSAAIAWGAAVGLANYGAAQFFLLAVGSLSGPLVFPANNISIVIGGALIGVLFWKEHLTRMNWIGLACAGTALLLLAL